jgi:AcrR family transcriptional regulator
VPKIVDWDARRDDVLEAAWRVMARDGYAKTTIRRIALEAGFSHGVLNHYFDNKHDILMSALLLCHQRVRERTRKHSEGLEGLDALRVAMLEALPLDSARALEAKIEVSFWHEVLGNPELADVQAKEIERLWGRIYGLLEEARGLGQLRPDLRLEDATDQLLIMIDGISAKCVMHPDRIPPSRQLALLDAQLATLRSEQQAAVSRD